MACRSSRKRRPASTPEGRPGPSERIGRWKSPAEGGRRAPWLPTQSVPHGARGPAQLERRDEVGVRPPREAVGQEGRALGGVLDPGGRERGQREDRPERGKRPGRQG